MLPLLSIVGATGSQGGSVLASALASKQYRIRAITRNTKSASALKLSCQGVEVVPGELGDENSLIKAFEGSTAIFAMTNFFENFPRLSASEAQSIELQQGINLANAASKTPNLQHYIWSTLPDSGRITEGRFPVPWTVSKVQVDQYIKSKEELWKKTTLLWCSFYAQNFAIPLLTPTFVKTVGKYVQLSPVPANTPVETVGDVTKNLGIFTTAIFAQPEKTKGKIVLGSIECTTMGGMLQYWSDATGKESLYVQLASVEEYDRLFPVFGAGEGMSLKHWEEALDKSWVDLDGVEIVTRDDLKIDGSQFVSVKETCESMEWSGL